MVEANDRPSCGPAVDNSLHEDIKAQIEEGLDRSGFLIFVLSSEMRIEFISRSAAAFMGRRPEDVIGRTPGDLGLPVQLHESIKRLVNEALTSKKVLRGTYVASLREIKQFEYEISPIFAGGPRPKAVLAFVYDRTAQALERKVLEAIVKVNDIVRPSLGSDDLVKRTVRALSGSLNDDAFALVIDDNGTWRVDHSFDLPPEEMSSLENSMVCLVSGLIGGNAPVSIGDISRDPRVPSEIAHRTGAGPLLVVPVELAHGVKIALLFFRFDDRPFGSIEMDLGEKMASSVAVAITDMLMVRDLRAADLEKESMLVRLSKERENLAAIFEANPLALALFQRDGENLRLALCSKIFRDDTYGAVPHPLEGKRMEELGIPEETAYLRKMAEAALRTGQTQVSEEHVHHTGREQFPTKIMMAPISRQPDTVLMAGVSISDLVNAKKQLEEYATRIEAERVRLRTIIDTLPVGVVLVDASGKVIETNSTRRAEIWGTSPKDRALANIYPSRARWSNTGMSVAKDEWPIARALRKGECVKGEMIDITRFDGKRGTELISAAPIHDASGKRIGAVGIMQDITEQRQLEQDAVEAKERAETFLDLLTHDVQGHNAAISGYIQMALSKDKQGKRKDDLQKALEAIKASTELIDTVRKIQMVETHDTAHGHIELSSTLEDVASEITAVGGKRVHIEMSTKPDSFILASPMIREVFMNLLINSVRHSEEEVHITVRQNRIYDGGREYHKFIIEDDGPGIPDDVKPSIFLRKYRGRTKAKGSGLGLYLTKRLVEEHGGKIWMEDRVPGNHAKGVRFIVHLPTVSMPSVHATGTEHA